MINTLSILLVAFALLALCALMYLVLDTMRFMEATIHVTLHRMEHDLQQIKVRQTWSRKRERKDLRQEVLKSKRLLKK